MGRQADTTDAAILAKVSVPGDDRVLKAVKPFVGPGAEPILVLIVSDLVGAEGVRLSCYSLAPTEAELAYCARTLLEEAEKVGFFQEARDV